MKRILITLFTLLIASHYFYTINAQNKDEKKKEKKIVIKIDKEENGKITKVDTTIFLKDGEDASKILEKYGIKEDENLKRSKTFDVKIVDNDTIVSGMKHKMVYVNVDDNGDTLKHKSHKKEIIMITDDCDGNVLIHKDKGGKEIYHIKEFDKDFKGDSGIWEERVIIGDEDGIKHKKVYKFKHNGNDDEANMFVFSDDNMGPDHLIMNGDNDDSDSTIIIVKKYKDGKEQKETKKQIKRKKENKVMIKVLDPEKEDLAKLKLKENYKKLDVKDFNINLINKKMTFNFELAEKANTSIKLIDKDGKNAFAEELKLFQGKYSKEMDALKGEFFVQINQGNKYFIRKVILDFN
jgi:hypothetical protein